MLKRKCNDVSGRSFMVGAARKVVERKGKKKKTLTARVTSKSAAASLASMRSSKVAYMASSHESASLWYSGVARDDMGLTTKRGADSWVVTARLAVAAAAANLVDAAAVVCRPAPPPTAARSCW